jgi:methionyl-tRNA formyltransferase
MSIPLVFFGSSPFSVAVLQQMLDRHISVASVVTGADKPVGRNQLITPNPVKVLAGKYNLPVFTSLAEFTAFPAADSVALVAAFGKIIPPSVLDRFSGRIYNIHPSLLPLYRGPSPLQQQILDQVTDTGVTLIQLDEQMDHGPIIVQARDTLLPTDTWLTLGRRLFTVGVDLFIDFLHQPEQYPPISQNDSLATYTHKITRDSGFIPWDEFRLHPAGYNSQLRAFSGWPGVWTLMPDGKRLKLISISPLLVQLEGKTPHPWSSINSA